MNSHKIFEKIDRFIFRKLDTAIKAQFYKKIADNFTDLSEKHQRIVSRILSAISVFTPLILILIVYISSYSIKSKVDTQKKILTSIEDYFSLKSEIADYALKFLSSIPIQSQQDLKRKIRDAGSSYGISSSNVTIDQFEGQTDSGVIKSTASLSFKELTSDQLAALLENLVNSYKFTITQLEVNKNTKNSLNGSFSIQHYSK